MSFLSRYANKNIGPIVFLLVVSFVLSSYTVIWGFYGHRKINEMAVYCLPEDMITLFKKNIDYISEHAVDPDKRRYATKHEAVRHYIDIDHWGEKPFENVPKNFTDAVTKFGEFYFADGIDTTIYTFNRIAESKDFFEIRQFVRNNWIPQRYEDEQIYNCDTLQKYFEIDASLCNQFRFEDVFSTYGILPYELENQQRRLTSAFAERDIDRIIRIATDMGHYIADAHVPLHTTENYNGQFTKQDGIHAFWESRLPELFAESQYDFFVGQADYIDDPKAYFWKIVKKSNDHLEKVLAVEKQISQNYSKDRQYCYEERLNVTVRLECEEYAAEYHKLLDGMVEDRMRGSIKSVADAWFTAWVNAGQPEFREVGLLSRLDDQLEKAFNLGEIFGRKH